MIIHRYFQSFINGLPRLDPMKTKENLTISHGRGECGARPLLFSSIFFHRSMPVAPASKKSNEYVYIHIIFYNVSMVAGAWIQ